MDSAVIEYTETAMVTTLCNGSVLDLGESSGCLVQCYRSHIEVEVRSRSKSSIQRSSLQCRKRQKGKFNWAMNFHSGANQRPAR